LSKKLLKILKLISKDLEFYSDEILDTIENETPELFDLSDELAFLESSESLREDELDILKSLLVYLLVRKTSFDKEDIYSVVFGGGRRIIWN